MSRLLPIRLVLLSVTLMLPSLGVSIGTADELRWKFAVGDRFSVEYEQAVEQTTEVLLKPVTVETRSTVAMTWEVMSVDEAGNATIKQQFTRLTLSLLSSRGDSVEFDSDSDDPTNGKTSEVGKVLMPLLAAPFEVKMSPRGELLSVSVPEESMATIRQSASSMRLRQLFSNEALTETLSFVAATLPEAAVETGDSWTVEREAGTAELPLRIVHELTYQRSPGAEPQPMAEGADEELADRAGDASLGRIAVQTTIVPGEAPEAREDETKRGEIASQSSQGVLWFDLEQGHPARSIQIQDLVTTTPLREMTIEVTARSTTRSSVTRLGAE